MGSMRSRGLLTLAFLGLLLAPAPAPGDDAADTIALFRKFFARAEQPRERYEAVLVLQGLDRLDAAKALLPALDDPDFSVRQAAVGVLGSYRSEEIGRWLLDEVVAEGNLSKKPALHASVVEALGLQGHAWAFDACLGALYERDVSVQLAAIGALGRLRNPEACPALSAVAADPDGALALAALDALAAIGSAPGAEAAVVGAMRHDDWRVRARAIEAVVKLRLKAGVGPLIERMAEEEGRLRGDAYEALKYCTTWNLGEDPEAWRKWWGPREATFVMPDPEKMQAALEKAKTSGTTRQAVAKTSGTKQFMTIATKSENMVFVIDVSGSMDIHFGDPERLKMTGRTYPSLQRLAIVKEELITTIGDLPETTNFNIIAFATDVKPWKKAPVRANILHRAEAIEWVSKLKPLGLKKGGTTFEVATGMKVEEETEGATNIYLAMMAALGEDASDYGKPKTGSGEYVLETTANDYDTIFFLSDGEPTVGKTVDMFEIRREVQRVNAYRGAQIHIIWVGEFGGEDFEHMARENGGIFVRIGG